MQRADFKFRYLQLFHKSVFLIAFRSWILRVVFQEVFKGLFSRYVSKVGFIGLFPRVVFKGPRALSKGCLDGSCGVQGRNTGVELRVAILGC